MEKHEWRKKEKEIYLPKTKPELIDIPRFQYITIAGAGNPNRPLFSKQISVLYSMSYALKMNLKKMEKKPKGYCDYTVYPLEGIWDLSEEAKKTFTGEINKDDFVYTIMIRQPDFISPEIFQEILAITQQKKPHKLLSEIKLEKISDGKCIQMMHLGSYDSELESFIKMETFATAHHLERTSKRHREIYLSDFRKVPAEKLKTVLRFKVRHVP